MLLVSSKRIIKAGELKHILFTANKVINIKSKVYKTIEVRNRKQRILYFIKLTHRKYSSFEKETVVV